MQIKSPNRFGLFACRFLIALFIVGSLGPPVRATDVDIDQDGVADSLEQSLLDTFVPVMVGDLGCPNQWAGDKPVPVDPIWFLRNSRLLGDIIPGGPFPVREVLAVSPTVTQLENFAQRPDATRQNLAFLDTDSPWGYSSFPDDTRTWARAVTDKSGVFGRVWRPWPAQTNLYSVQYYVLFSGNINLDGNGFHDGDWVCVDYCVDTSGTAPHIIHAVYHCHGPQILLTRDAIEFEAGHPVFYLEPGVQEAWPNASPVRGYASWPLNDGFAKNYLWQVAPFGIGSEEDITIRHGGTGCRYLLADANHPVRNLGEIGHPMSSDENVRAVLAYRGKWGNEAGGNTIGDAFADLDNPEGPPFNNKMWFRMFTFSGGGEFGYSTACPYSLLEDPLRPDLDRTLRFQTDDYGCDSDNDGYLYFRCPTLFLPIAYVQQGYSGARQEGLRTRPMSTLQAGVNRVASYGVLRLYAGAVHTAGSITISKPMVIESFGGPVTIGP